MNYELAKKLKDAEFPQSGISKKWYVILFDKNGISDEKGVVLKYNFPLMEGTQTVYVSELSELIEACNKIMGTTGKYEPFNLHWFPSASGKKWEALRSNQKYLKQFPNGSHLSDSQIKLAEIIGEGDTPEEAVANLWLELNKNGQKHS